MGSKSWFSWHSAVLLLLLVSLVAPASPAPALARADTLPVVLINELDSDTAGTDALEFVELYDGGYGNTALDGLVVVFYNGSNDLSYAALDLDTYTTNAAGYFTLGNAAVPGVDLVFAGNLLQNGQDAVALYTANGSDFPNNTPVTVANLIDAIVYDTSDADDPGLLVLLNAGQPQVDENSRSASADDSNQRCPNGSGGARNTYTYLQAVPSTDGPNACPVDAAPEVTGVDPADGATGVAVDANLAVTFSENVDVDAGWFDITCTNSGNHAATAGGGPQSFTLDPDLDFSAGEGCTATVYAAAVHDQDTNDPPDIMEADYVWTFETAVLLAAPVINEFSASTVGTDVEYVEVYGAPSTGYSTYTILEIEGDSGSAFGTVDEVIAVGTTDAGGFWLQNLAANALENGTLTLLLVEAFTGAFGNDLDTNDDGVFDVTPWSAIVDAVAVNDGGTGDLTYGMPVLGPNYDGVSPFAPGGASRYPDGTDTNTTADWIRNDFDLAGIPGYPGTIGPGEAYNTPGAPNAVYVPPPEACGDPFTPIYQVQGSGLTSPLVGTEVALEGIVVGDFQNNGLPDNGDLNGFHVQDTAGDGDPATSDGVFVYYPSGATDVIVGDGVRVRGTVSEYYGLTEVTVSQLWLCSNGNSVAPTAVSLPVATVDDFEPYEGMLVIFPQALYLSEYFDFDRYGEIVLTTDRQNQPTAVYEPGSPEQAALAQANLLSRITLDDGRTAQNPDPAQHPNGSVFDMSNLFRGGDMVANVTGVLDYGFDLYRIQPVQGADYTPVNLRTPAPDDVGGSLKVASFNLLNYFTTIDTGAPVCGPNGNLECRGADTVAEFTRQRNKLIPALATVNADVVGLVEIENHPGDVPTADLVSGLNDMTGAGTYDYVATGAVGTDAIRVALIYKPAAVTPVGAHAILDSSVDPRFLDTKNRPVLAQAFQENATGSIFTVAVNHLKSKGSGCNDVGDPDLGDGAGNCNLTRKHAAEALVDWLAGDPTGSGVPEALIVGDLNSYDKEDPIDVLVAGGYTDLEGYFHGEYAYSYLFDGQLGYLDYALPNAALLDQVTGATVWHINADEPDLINYDMDFKQDPQDALYAPDAYRSADHDPIIVGLSFCDPVHDADFAWDPAVPYVGQEVTFTGTAQGSGPIYYAWAFNTLELGEGLRPSPEGDNPVTHVFDAPGTYLVSMWAWNDCGFQLVQHEVTVDPTPPWMHVGFAHLRYVDRGYGKYALRARVQILDPVGSLVPSAMVYVEWTAPNGTVTPQSRSTNAIGEVGFKAQTHQTGQWQICVTDVVKAGWVYDPGSNVEDCEDVTIP